MNIIHCENCRFWQDGYCTLRKKETCDGATFKMVDGNIVKEDKNNG